MVFPDGQVSPGFEPTFPYQVNEPVCIETKVPYARARLLVPCFYLWDVFFTVIYSSIRQSGHKAACQEWEVPSFGRDLFGEVRSEAFPNAKARRLFILGSWVEV